MSDSKNSKGGAHLSDAHLPNVDGSKAATRRRAQGELRLEPDVESCG
jgi:hypothetical protein